MNDSRDPDFEQYLRGNSEVSRAYRQLRGAQVPARIDAKLAELARSAHPAPRHTMREREPCAPNRPSWFAPFTLAASVLLSVAVLLAIALDPNAGKGRDDTVRLIPARAARGERPALRAPPPAGSAVRRESVEVVPRLFEPRRLFTSDPPNSREKHIDGAQLPAMPVEVIIKDPREWLARIQRLRELGRDAEAQHEAQEFRKVFPNYH